MGFMLVGFLALVVILFIRVRGQIHHSLAPLGPTLAQSGLLEDLLSREQPISGEERVLVVNGQRFSLETESLPISVEDALEQFMERCPTGSQLGEPIASELQGYAICASGTGDDDSSLGDRVSAFTESSDVGQLGTIEYAYAVASSDGGKTSMLRLSSTDRLMMDELVRTDGRDVPNADPIDFPRPPDGPRVIHSYEEGLPYGFYVYGRSERSPEELRRWYRDHVDETIWVELDLEAQAERLGAPPPTGDSMYFARREDPTRYVMVEFTERPPNERRPGQTMVAIAEAQ